MSCSRTSRAPSAWPAVSPSTSRSVPTSKRRSASSFVNRVSPANVGGMALNVRFLQKAGVPTTEAVTGVGLNSIVGAIVHVVLLVVFFAWAGQGGGHRIHDPRRQQGARHRSPSCSRWSGVVAGDSPRPPHGAHPGARLRQAGLARASSSLGALAREARRALRRVGGRDARVHRARSPPRSRRCTAISRSPRSAPCISARR